MSEPHVKLTTGRRPRQGDKAGRKNNRCFGTTVRKVGGWIVPGSATTADILRQTVAELQRIKLRYSDALKAGLCAPYELKAWEDPRGPFGLVFCASNKAARLRAAELRGASWVGIDSGEVPTRIARWKTGQLGLLCANRMLWEGLDEPRCAAVWIDRDTESEIALVQMAGRALRYQAGKVARAYTRSPKAWLRLSIALIRLDR